MGVGHFLVVVYTLDSMYLNSQVPNSLGASPFTFYYLPNTLRACVCARTYVRTACIDVIIIFIIILCASGHARLIQLLGMM